MASDEQAVLVWIKLSDEAFGSGDDEDIVFALEDELVAAIGEQGAGEFDGNEFGDGGCTLYMYGRSADCLFEVIAPILRAASLPLGSYVVKRYGDPGAPEERILL